MSGRTTVKYGDTHDVTWTINADLTGATLAGKVRLKNTSGAGTAITITLVTGGSTSTVKHTLSGSLAVGEYDLEIEATQSGKISTTPTVGQHRLVVVPSIA